MSKLSHLSSKDQELLKLGPVWSFVLISKADGNMDEKEYKKFLSDLDTILGKTQLAHTATHEEVEISGEILKAVKAEFDTLSLTVYKYPLKPLEGLRKIAESLDMLMTKGEAAFYKQVLLDIAIDIADSSGGNLFLQNNISKIEATVIGDIKQALRVS